MENEVLDLFSNLRVNRAVEIVRPSIEAFLNGPLAQRRILCVAVLDPVLNDQPFKGSFGELRSDRSRWEYAFDDIAAGKARLALRERMDTRRIVRECPHLLRPGDVARAGGVYLDGLAVGASGVDPYWDEMFAHMIAVAIKAVVIDAVSQIDGLYV